MHAKEEAWVIAEDLSDEAWLEYCRQVIAQQGSFVRCDADLTEAPVLIDVGGVKVLPRGSD